MKQAAVINYDLLNNFAGKLGEHMGVQLIIALFILTVSYALKRSKKLSIWFSRRGYLAAILALPYKDLLNLDLGPFLSISGSTISLWTIALGIGFFKQSR